MPSNHSRIARPRRQRASSPLPPSSPPPPSSSPRRSPSPLPRASSPELPASIMLQPVTDPALRRTQEAARKRFNRKIVKLKKKLAQNPDNAVWQVKLEHALQDYKEEWGDFIADKHAKKFAAKRDRLLKARQLALYGGFFLRTRSGNYKINPAYRTYYEGRKALFDKYDVDIEPDDRWTRAIETTLDALFFYTKLEANAGGDRDVMTHLALESFTINLRNPYQQGDKRRAELEAKYRAHLHYFARSGYTVDAPLGTETKTHFQWTCHPDQDRTNFKDIILNFTRGRSFKSRLEEWGTDACKEVGVAAPATQAGVVPATVFYGAM
ncbi:hypothetical protein B0H16DRAFT_1753132 [Mycena metata]|uniref:Uncharacterized protein n=1 Tax=Mycena metata TaxID=1033252 RepID=A0AAD7DCC0_9AGAR|nr:hypothetical protein B0H16DRAFT_1753132 [Mycena metata]